ncbi:sigma-54-dependent Fis family transcriptional regulator [Streptomyces hydrogenans]|uniref:sigma-54-dependent Fis family transcriptional regulator n=1 Tax=Streptomyces hydrogenans TaxID=1873719 RepID=UPI0038077B7B
MVGQLEIARARDMFLQDGTESPLVRPATLRAWKRSRAAGAAHLGAPSLASFEEVERDSAVLRAAEPVVSAIMRRLGTADYAVMVTDRDARILGRWMSGPTMEALMDEMCVVPGALFGESDIGSTGLGTVLEDRSTTVVDGTEHYNTRFDRVVAVGTPIVHPGTGCIEGALDLVCPTGASPEIMVALIERAAQDAGEHLLTGYAAHDRALLDAFLRSERRGPRRPVAAVNARMIMANHLAEPLLGSDPAWVLWERVQTALSSPRSSLRLTDAHGEVLDVDVRPVDPSDRTAGALLQLSAAPPTAPSARAKARDRDAAVALAAIVAGDLPGRSESWRTTLVLASRALLARGHLLLHGPVGTGKSALAEALRSAASPADTDGRSRAADSPVIDDLHTWSPARLADLRRELNADGAPRVVATATSHHAQGLSDELLAMFDHVIELPDLSRRPEDIADIAAAVTAKVAPQTVLAPDAVSDLVRRSWPGNVAQLTRTLRAAVERAPGNRLRATDLPPATEVPRSRRRLTYLESAEREAIAAVLVAVHGNRSKAAEVLGVSRATLYRKLEALSLD